MKKKIVRVAQRPLELLVRAVCAAYPTDPSKPSVLLSCLADGGFYASVVRYRERFGEGKFVVCNARDASLSEVVVKLAHNWRAGVTAGTTLGQVLDRWTESFPPGCDNYGSLP
jgi:hypothetical protein